MRFLQLVELFAIHCHLTIPSLDVVRVAVAKAADLGLKPLEMSICPFRQCRTCPEGIRFVAVVQQRPVQSEAGCPVPENGIRRSEYSYLICCGAACDDENFLPGYEPLSDAADGLI